MNEKKDYIASVFDEARARGLCHNQKEFAELLALNPSTVSSALNGVERSLTDRLVKRVRIWAEANLGKEPKKEARPDIVIPAATMDLYTSMAKSIDRLTSLVERLQPGASAFSGAYGQKNPLLDRK